MINGLQFSWSNHDKVLVKAWVIKLELEGCRALLWSSLGMLGNNSNCVSANDTQVAVIMELEGSTFWV